MNITVNTDEAPEVTHGILCDGATATLRVVNPKSGRIYQWSTDPNFGTILHEGTEYK